MSSSELMGDENAGANEHEEGIVVRSTGGWCEVKCRDDIVSCTVRGKFRLAEENTTNPVAVGDHVTVSRNPDGTGRITKIHERHNKLSRRAAGRRAGMEHIIAANIDAAWCIQSIKLPAFNPGFVDRFLVMTETYHIPAGCVINKSDLSTDGQTEEQLAFWQELYESLGYAVLRTSVFTKENVEHFADLLSGKTNVIAGPSGSGKTSLINCIDPGIDLKTSPVSSRTRKGKHTTTHVSLHPLRNGGFIIDTPGIREFGIWDLQPEEVSGYFVEMRPLIEHCRFPGCTHDHEPGCAVKEAVEEGRIYPQRYDSYLNILDSVKRGEKDVGR